jgi:type I restriction enzyme S subunit
MSLPRYSEYKDSGVAWLGEVPAHWGIKRIKQSTYLKGRVGWKGLTSDEYLEEGYAYLVTGTDFSQKIIRWSNCHCVAKERYEDDPFIHLKDGDLLITKDGTIGKLALVAGLDKPACLNSGIFLVRPVSDYKTEFMYWVLGSKPFATFCDLSSVGSTIQHLYQNVFENFAFPTPSLPEQADIATFLDRETAKIDGLIAEQEKLISLLAEKRQATISHVVTKGLNPDAPMKDSGAEWVGVIPAHWEVRKIKDVSKLESGHTPSKQFPEYWENCEIPWVSLNDSKYLAANDYISDTAVKINELGLANSSARVLPSQTVVFTRDATIGLASITTRPMAVSQHLIAWCPTGQMESKYLLRVFNAMKKHLDSYTFGATIKTIGMGDVKTLVTPVPPLAEQIEIVRFLDIETACLDALTAEATRGIALLKERRSALISAAVTGKIDIRNISTWEKNKSCSTSF